MSFCAQLAANTSTGLASQTYSSILTPPIVNVLKQISDSVVVSASIMFFNCILLLLCMLVSGLAFMIHLSFCGLMADCV